MSLINDADTTSLFPSSSFHSSCPPYLLLSYPPPSPHDSDTILAARAFFLEMPTGGPNSPTRNLWRMSMSVGLLPRLFYPPIPLSFLPYLRAPYIHSDFTTLTPLLLPHLVIVISRRLHSFTTVIVLYSLYYDPPRWFCENTCCMGLRVSAKQDTWGHLVKFWKYSVSISINVLFESSLTPVLMGLCFPNLW